MAWRPLASIAWLRLVSAIYPCPRGCKCELGEGGGDCLITASCSKLASLPATDLWPDRLDCLFINSPQLGELDAEAKERGLMNLPHTLRRLDLAECSLGEIPSGVFWHLGELRVLNLEFNRLQQLPEDLFHGLYKLKVLWLTGNHYEKKEKDYARMAKAANRIKWLHQSQFKDLTNLQVLLLHHNALKDLPEGIFDNLGKLRVLKLFDNPFADKASSSHPVFRVLLKHGSDVLRQLDLDDDSGDVLEDYWEVTNQYLSDDFRAGPFPSMAGRGHPHYDHEEL